MIDRVLGILAGTAPAAQAEDGDRRPVRIGVDRSASSAGLDTDIAAAFDRCQARLAATGATIIDVGFPPLADLNTIAAVITGFEAARIHAAQLAARPELYAETIRPRILVAACIPEAAHTAALRLRGSCLRDMLEKTFSAADLVVWPTLRVSGHRIDALEDAAVAGSVAREYLTPNRPINLLGLPSLTVPAGRDRNGIPVGVQIVGPPFSDRAILALAPDLVEL